MRLHYRIHAIRITRLPCGWWTYPALTMACNRNFLQECIEYAFPHGNWESPYSNQLFCEATTLWPSCDSLHRPLNASLDMLSVQSFLYNAAFVVITLSPAVPKTAAGHAVLCGQFQSQSSHSGHYSSKSRSCAHSNMRHYLMKSP